MSFRFESKSDIKSESNKDEIKTQIGVGLKLGETPLPPESEPLYRGDGRKPKDIFKDGFRSRGTNTDLLLHAQPPGAEYLFDSAYISTSSLKEAAIKFPKHSWADRSYLYEIHTQRQTINVIEKLASMVAQDLMNVKDWQSLQSEAERAIFRRIQPSEIKGCWQVYDALDPEGNVFTRNIREPFIPNSNYPSYSIPRYWNRVKMLGHILAGVGLVLDGTSLYRESQKSKQSGDYSNTYREGTRIAGGWTGAYTAGIAGAKAGIWVGGFFPPYGLAVCSFAAGLAASVSGYYYGGEVATKIYDVNRSQASSEIIVTLLDAVHISFGGVALPSVPEVTAVNVQSQKAKLDASVVPAKKEYYKAMVEEIREENAIKKLEDDTLPDLTVKPATTAEAKEMHFDHCTVSSINRQFEDSPMREVSFDSGGLSERIGLVAASMRSATHGRDAGARKNASNSALLTHSHFREENVVHGKICDTYDFASNTGTKANGGLPITKITGFGQLFNCSKTLVRKLEDQGFRCNHETGTCVRRDVHKILFS